MEALSKGINSAESIGSFISITIPSYLSSTALSNPTLSTLLSASICSLKDNELVEAEIFLVDQEALKWLLPVRTENQLLDSSWVKKKKTKKIIDTFQFSDRESRTAIEANQSCLFKHNHTKTFISGFFSQLASFPVLYSSITEVYKTNLFNVKYSVSSSRKVRKSK